MKKLIMTSCMLVSSLAAIGTWAEESPTPLTLNQAIEYTLKNNPDLATYEWDTRIAEARELDAGLRPNPELSLEIEGIRTSRGPSATSTSGTEQEIEQGASSGLSEAEYTLSLTQLVELGGKRAKRVQAARAEGVVIKHEYEIARAEVLTELAQRYVAVVATQESLRLAQESQALVENVTKTIAARVEAGHVSPIEHTRAQLEVGQAQLTTQSAEQGLRVARRQLASMWGKDSLGNAQVMGQLSAIEPLISLSDLRKQVKGSPDIRYWMAALDHQEALMTVEQSKAKPDLEVSLGYRRAELNSHNATLYDISGQPATPLSSSRSGFNDSADESLILEFSLPLPLFNRNQGKIKEAEYQIKKASAQRRAQEQRIYMAIDTAYAQLQGAYTQVEQLQSTMLPQATQAYNATQRGYTAGKFGYLDVLEAQRTLIELRKQHVQALLTHHQTRINLERLTGMNVSVNVQGEQL